MRIVVALKVHLHAGSFALIIPKADLMSQKASLKSYFFGLLRKRIQKARKKACM
jgi:hypothetical protein